MSKLKFFILREVASTLSHIGWVCDSLKLQRTEVVVWEAYNKVFKSLTTTKNHENTRDSEHTDKEYPPKLQ